MSGTNKYYVSLDNLPANEHIIFKLICSVSQKSKGRDNQFYLLPADEVDRPDIVIRDISQSDMPVSPPGKVEAYLSNDNNSDINNLIPRPLIVTRVLTALDNIIMQLLKDDKTKSSVSICADNPKLTGSSSIDFDITEEEASELAIVHDETLSNPANEVIKEESQGNSSSVIPLITSQSTSSNFPTALVVDDSPSVRKQLELELDLFKVDVDYAGTAEEALSLLNNKKYDIAFLDVVLPDKDGFQICKHIKSKCKNTIVMMLTGKATQSDKIKGSLAGCDDYLVKPVGRNTFQNATGKYLSLKARESYAGI